MSEGLDELLGYASDYPTWEQSMYFSSRKTQLFASKLLSSSKYTRYILRKLGMSKFLINYSDLKKFFGFTEFKGLQEKVIESILSKQNTFVIMPTGGGKSLCYQLPALMQEGTAIVVSPLIALMKNQVDALRSISSEHGIAHVLNSSLNKTEIKQVKADISNGITKLLYVAPESLTKEENVDFLKNEKNTFIIGCFPVQFCCAGNQSLR
mgnify:CR=1 FL=1